MCPASYAARGRTSTRTTAHSAPRGAPSSRITVWSGKRSRSSAPCTRGSVAQAITVGPEPDSVAPAQPPGGSARIVLEHARRPVGLVEPVVRAPRRRASRRRSRRPRRAARPARRSRRPRRAGRSPGAPRREVSVEVRSLRDHGDRRRAEGVSRSGRCGRPRRASGRRAAPPRGCRREARASSPAASSSSAVASGAAATRPSAIAAADEPSPRSSGILFTKRIACRPGRHQPVRADGKVRSVRGELRGALALDDDPSPSVTSSSFQRSKATAAVSKPAPMLAEVAGARTFIERAAAAIASGSASTCTSAGA